MKKILAFLFSCCALIGFSFRTKAQEKQRYPFLPDSIPVCLPLKKLSVTSSFGYRLHPVTGKYAFHSGIDLKANFDTVYAILPGIVKAGYDSLLGIYIKIDYGDLQLSYGHLSQIFVIPGDTVEAGMAIAKSGDTGRLTGPHLHFSVRYRQQCLDPLKFLHQILILNSNYHE
jgi:murein DD-endopeptidase MepM/ murein hydrolase activator NlpD